MAGIIARIRAAGVRVCMMTGDHALTVTALSFQIGLLTQIKFDTFESFQGAATDEKKWASSALLLIGDDMNDLEEDDWYTINKYDELVFERLKPEQKVIDIIPISDKIFPRLNISVEFFEKTTITFNSCQGVAKSWKNHGNGVCFIL